MTEGQQQQQQQQEQATTTTTMPETAEAAVTTTTTTTEPTTTAATTTRTTAGSAVAVADEASMDHFREEEEEDEDEDIEDVIEHAHLPPSKYRGSEFSYHQSKSTAMSTASSVVSANSSNHDSSSRNSHHRPKKNKKKPPPPPEQQQQTLQQPQQSLPPEQLRLNRWFAGLHVLAVLLGTAGFVMGLVAQLDDAKRRTTNSSSNTLGGVSMDNDAATSNNSSSSVLEAIVQRGVLRCGIQGYTPGLAVPRSSSSSTTNNNNNGADGVDLRPDLVGLDVALCRALSAAIFSTTSNFEIEIVMVPSLVNETAVDVLFDTTYTMQRDVYVPELDRGVEFSRPYYVDGLTFGAVNSDWLECAELGVFNGTLCADLTICATTDHAAVLQSMWGEVPTIDANNKNILDYFPHTCQVYAGPQLVVGTAALEFLGYRGPYVVSTQKETLTRESTCLVTRQGDSRWSDFVNYVLQSLMYAEEKDIRQVTSDQMPTTQLFGSQFENMFRHAVAAGGNYGELYVNYLERYLPRAGGPNRLNVGDAPRILSYPLGNWQLMGPSVEKVSPTIQRIKQRGFLNCGLTTGGGINTFDAEARTWRGVATDICRAISAALFDGVDDRFLVTNVPFANQFQLLADEVFDLHGFWFLTVTRDIRDSVAGQGFTYSLPYYASGSAFGGLPEFVECADNLDVFSPECQALRVCVVETSGSSELLLEKLGNEFYIVPVSARVDQFTGLRNGVCNAVFGPAVVVQESIARATGYGPDLPYATGNRIFNIEMYGMTTRQDDPVWSDFVRWVGASLIYAEEQGITQATADEMPRPQLFGPLHVNCFYYAVNAVGNLGEIIFRNARAFGRPIVSQLASVTDSQIYAIPGFESVP